jgi:hypothetical protein
MVVTTVKMFAFTFDIYSCPCHKRICMRYAWSHRKCEELSPLMCPPCVHKQDLSCTPAHGSQGIWGPMVAVADSANPHGQSRDKESAASRGGVLSCWKYICARTVRSIPSHRPYNSRSRSLALIVPVRRPPPPPRRMVQWADPSITPHRTLTENRYWKFAFTMPRWFTSCHTRSVLYFLPHLKWTDPRQWIGCIHEGGSTLLMSDTWTFQPTRNFFCLISL